MEILQIFGITLTFGAVVGACVIYGLKKYTGSYLSEKGINLATKEDTGAITQIVETIKSEQSEKLARLQEQLKATSTLRFLAAEKRFQAHQDAYRFAIKMKQMAFNRDNDLRNQASSEWGDFWQRNCLYLDKDVREAFADAAMASQAHLTWLGTESHLNEADRQVNTNMKKMDRLVEVILEAVQLPPIVRDFDVATGEESR